MSSRMARMQRRAARKSIEGWSKANAAQVRDGIIEQMAHAQRVRRRRWAAVITVLSSAAALLWWAVRS